MIGAKTVKAKVDTLINDRVTQPIQIGLLVAGCALVLAVIASGIAVSK